MPGIRKDLNIQNILSLAVFVTPFIVSFIPVQQFFNSHHIKNYIALLLVSVLALIMFVYSKRTGLSFSFNPIFLIFTGYILIVFLSSLLNGELKRAVPELLILCIVAIMLFIAGNLNFAGCNTLFFSITAAVLVFIMFGLSFLFTAGIRLVLFTYNANYLAALLTILYPFLFAGFLAIFNEKDSNNKRISKLIFYSASIAAAAFLLFRTGSRAGVICSGFEIFILLILLLYKHNTGKVKLILAACLVVIASVAVLSIVMKFRVNLNFSGRNSSFPLVNFFGPRLPEWRSALAIWQSDNPLSFLFGRGAGSYLDLSNSYFPADFRLYERDWNTGRSVMHAHNEVLQQLAEGGIAGLFFWAMVVITGIKKAVGGYLKDRESSDNLTSAVVSLSIVAGLLLFTFMSAAMGSISVRMMFFLLLLLPPDTDDSALPESRQRKPLNSFCSIAVLLITMAITAAGSFYYLPEMKADRIFRSAVDATLAKNDLKAAEKLELVLEFKPDNMLYRYERFKTLLRLGRGAEALEAGSQILEDIPGYRKTERLLAAELLRQQNYNGALSYLDAYIGRDSVEKGTHLQRVACTAVLGDSKRTEDALSELLYWSSMEALYYLDGYDLPDENARDALEQLLLKIRENGITAAIDSQQIKKSAEKLGRVAESADFPVVYFRTIEETAQLLEARGLGRLSKPFKELLLHLIPGV